MMVNAAAAAVGKQGDSSRAKKANELLGEEEQQV